MEYYMPIIFAAFMGLAILLYVILDGYDLGVGMLLHYANNRDERTLMLSSIGPFWDANETWLVMATGILLFAFPKAHGIILQQLYVPTLIMLLGLVIRGAAFDFRAKANIDHTALWERLFSIGSWLASLSQGYMIGLYITSFKNMLNPFAFLTAISLSGGYMFIASCWLIMKTDHSLQLRAIRWARSTLLYVVMGILAVSLATPVVSPHIYEKWFKLPNIILLSPLPVSTACIIYFMYNFLNRLPFTSDRYCWLPFLSAVLIFVLCFGGLAYSFYPYIIIDKLTIWQASSSIKSLEFILYGLIVVFPCIISYTIYSYKVFWGKVREHHY
jgi:cytochrome d ubiquinol oxidase subunit II